MQTFYYLLKFTLENGIFEGQESRLLMADARSRPFNLGGASPPYKVAMKIVFGISNVAHSRLKYLVMVFWYSLSAVIDELWPNRELPIEIWSKNVYFHRNRLKSRSKNGNLPRKWVENLKCAEVESSVKVNKKLSSFFLAQSFERKRRRRRQPYIGRPNNSSYGTTIPCRTLVFVPSIRNTY